MARGSLLQMRHPFYAPILVFSIRDKADVKTVICNGVQDVGVEHVCHLKDRPREAKAFYAVRILARQIKRHTTCGLRSESRRTSN
jgi:hypothetical protein